MKCYKVQVEGNTLRWAASMAGCREAKKELVDEGTVTKPNSIKYVEAEVPTDKAGLLEFLNENCVFSENKG